MTRIPEKSSHQGHRHASRTQRTPSLYTELFQRHAANPILTARDWPYPAHTVFNAGACQVGDETILLVRVEDRRGHSHLTVARSNDGVSNWRIDSKPSFAPDPANYSGRGVGRGRSAPDLGRGPRPVDYRLHGLFAQRTAGVLAETTPRFVKFVSSSTAKGWTAGTANAQQVVDRGDIDPHRLRVRRRIGCWCRRSCPSRRRRPPGRGAPLTPRGRILQAVGSARVTFIWASEPFSMTVLAVVRDVRNAARDVGRHLQGALAVHAQRDLDGRSRHPRP